MGLLWFVAGVVVGLALAWLAEYLLDRSLLRRDGGLHDGAAVLMQASLEQAERELAELRRELARHQAWNSVGDDESPRG